MDCWMSEYAAPRVVVTRPDQTYLGHRLFWRGGGSLRIYCTFSPDHNCSTARSINREGELGRTWPGLTNQGRVWRG